MENRFFPGLNLESRVLCAGEMMLCLRPRDDLLLESASSFTCEYAGAEANTAMGLGNLGVHSAFFTVVPDHAIGDGVVRELSANHVDTSRVIHSTPEETPTHRLGTFFVEKGYGIRPSRVLYDRKHSAITEYPCEKIDMDRVFDAVSWLHITGITPAIAPSCADLTLRLLQEAKRRGVIVSFDGNYRSALWTWQQAREFCTGCLPYVDVLFGIEPYCLPIDPAHPELGDCKDSLPKNPTLDEQHAIFEKFARLYPNLRCIARHVRVADSSSENALKAFLWLGGETCESRQISFSILNRSGGGDAFVTGLIYAMLKNMPEQQALDYAVAFCALKHTMPGDFSTLTRDDRVWDVLNSRFDIRR